MDDRILAETVVDMLLFLEFSGDEAVNPGAAVGMQEGIAASLQRLPTGDRAAFVRLCRELAAKRTDPVEQRFILQLGDTLGLGG